MLAGRDRHASSSLEACAGSRVVYLYGPSLRINRDMGSGSGLFARSERIVFNQKYAA